MVGPSVLKKKGVNEGFSARWAEAKGDTPRLAQTTETEGLKDAKTGEKSGAPTGETKTTAGNIKWVN